MSSGGMSVNAVWKDRPWPPENVQNDRNRIGINTIFHTFLWHDGQNLESESHKDVSVWLSVSDRM